MKRLISMSIALILLAAALAIAMTTGNELKHFADDGEKDPGSLFGEYFDGYVVGVVELSHTFVNICVPPDTTNRQVIDVVRKYLKDHPEKLHSARS